MSSENFLIELENLFMTLADKTRLRLLNLMRENEICVCFFTEVLGDSQPKISRHLAYLRNAGLVSTRRDGKWMHYRIEMPENVLAAEILRNTLDTLKSQDDMQKDYENLIRICCSEDNSAIITHAPKLNTFANTNMSNKRDELETFLL